MRGDITDLSVIFLFESGLIPLSDITDVWREPRYRNRGRTAGAPLPPRGSGGHAGTSRSKHKPAAWRGSKAHSGVFAGCGLRFAPLGRMDPSTQ